MNKTKKGIIIVVIGSLLGATGILMGGSTENREVITASGLVCPADFRACPNGLRVARAGPNCEFASCSSAFADGYWQFNDHSAGISYSYPPKITAEYVSSVNWPPKFQFVTDSFSCANAGAETDRAGRTERRTVNGTLYCVSKKSRDVSGSKHTEFAYAFETNGVVPVLTFSLAFSNCSSFGSEKRKICEAEQSTFDLDKIVDNIAGSLVFQNTFNIGSGIRGRAILKICVEPGKCSDSGFRQTFGIYSNSESLVKTFTPDPSGAFKVELSPGDYVIRKSQTGSPYCSDARVTVVRNAYSEVLLSCDAGV